MQDWKTSTLTKIRKLIKEADPEVAEEAKWKKASNPEGVPTWSDHGMICTGETYKDHLKLTFLKGGQLKDAKKLFSTPGASRRAINIYENDKINEDDFKDLIREAVKINKTK